MKFVSAAVLVALVSLVVSGTSAVAQSPHYGWTISDSPTDPYSNTGPLVGDQTLYLWYACSDLDGMSSAAFTLQTSDGFILSFTPENGFFNFGTETDLLLSRMDCLTGPVRAGSIYVLNFGPGEYCIVPHPIEGRKTWDCSGQPWPLQAIGFSNLGGAPSCNEELCPAEDPTGACCLGDGSCAILTATECAGAGGEYQGESTGCDPDPCPDPVLYHYGWTISDSPTDPYSNTGPLVFDQTLYLWYACSDLDGMLAAAFTLQTSDGIIVSFTAENGFLNAGTGTDLLLAHMDCLTGPIRAGSIHVLNPVPSEYCIVPHPVEGRKTWDCSEQPWPLQAIGFSNLGGAPSCNEELCPASTDVPEAAVSSIRHLGIPRPNPATNRLSFDVTLAEAAHVVVSVFDVTGRMIRTLVDESLSPGVHNFGFQALDSEDPELAGGVYYLQLQSGAVQETRKFIIIR